MKITVVQFGARGSYAVPVIFENAGILSALFTDAAGNIGACRLMTSISGFLPQRHPLCRLAARRVPEEIAGRTVSFPFRSLAHAVHLRSCKTEEQRFRAHLHHSDALGRGVARYGFGDSTHLFSWLGEAGPALEAAKARGLTVVADVYITLDTANILARERERFPDWQPEPVLNPERIRQRLGMKDYLLECSDFFVCPSPEVQQDLVHRLGIAPDRTAVVRYAMDPRLLELEARPVPGRVLFPGTADLRKGIHYLAMAAEILHRRGRRYEFRVAGHASDAVRSRPECRALTFLDRVPRSAMREEYSRADIVALPTLAEGSAYVTYEALAAGVPLVTTIACGSVARDGIEARIVPERDPTALADAIEEIVEDRPRRQTFAAAARCRAAEYTWERYGERLLQAMRSFAR